MTKAAIGAVHLVVQRWRSFVLVGVMIEDYDMPGLVTENGVADLGFAWAAWIVDPGKNALLMLQLRS